MTTATHGTTTSHFGQQHMRFHDRSEWHRAVAAMVREGVTFEAYKTNEFYIIEFTGGY